ncbi:MAG: hypothetical protein OXC07_03335 [Kistimonas sp.]|nr:hypothetical protein [Kistimonas sp.]
MQTADTRLDARSPSPVPVPVAAVPGPVVTVVESPSRRRTPVLDGTQGACARQPGSTHPSTWPVPVLELLFRALNIGDLMACGQVCKHWHQVATSRRLMLHCLLHTWPASHRLQLESALDTALVRARLIPWCDRPAVSEQGAAANAVVDPLPRELLFTAVRRMLLTDRFRPASVQLSTGCPGRMQALVSSCDGRFMASAVQRPAWTGSQCSLSLWHCEAEPVVWAAHSRFQEGAVEQLALSADGSIRALSSTGRVQVWQRCRRVEASLHLAGAERLFEKDRVHKTVLSVDGKYLGVALPGRVLIYGEDEQEPGGWALRPEWSESLSRRVFAAHYDPDHVAMRFSDNNRHFVFAFEHRAFVCSRDLVGGWRKQALPLCSAVVLGQPALDAQGRLLALAYGSAEKDDRGWADQAHLQFWRYDEPPDGLGQAAWKVVTSPASGCALVLPIAIHPDTGYSVPMAFSPDCQLLAVPDWRDCRCLCIIPVSGPEAWKVKFLLRCKEGKMKQGCYEPVSFLQFSANSCYLVMRAGRTLTLWRRLSTRWSLQLRVNDPLRQGEVPFALSPDGFHCVAGTLSKNGQEQLSVWGPVSGGEYRRKYCGEVLSGFTVEKVQFTPDGTRILVVGYSQEFREGGQVGERKIVDARIVSRFLCWNLVPTPSRRPAS